jgi:hypothetical protein
MRWWYQAIKRQIYAFKTVEQTAATKPAEAAP